jgi:hypothetical protein
MCWVLRGSGRMIGSMREGRPKPVQFSMKFLFLVTTILAILLSLGEMAVPLLVPVVIAADLCRRALGSSTRRAEASLAAVWWFMITLLCIAFAVWLPGF